MKIQIVRWWAVVGAGWPAGPPGRVRPVGRTRLLAAAWANFSTKDITAWRAAPAAQC